MSDGYEPCDECDGRGFHVGPVCCGNLIDGDCRGECAVPEQVPCESCGGSGRQPVDEGSLGE